MILILNLTLPDGLIPHIINGSCKIQDLELEQDFNFIFFLLILRLSDLFRKNIKMKEFTLGKYLLVTPLLDRKNDGTVVVKVAELKNHVF